MPEDHPLRVIRAVVNAALGDLSGAFGQLYSRLGRPSIPPEKLLRALLLQAFYSIRSERQLMERLEYDLLFRWFVGLGIDDPVWDASTFSKNRDRLLAGEVAAQFLAAVLARPRSSAALGRPLHRRRHPDRGLGQHEELPPEGRPARRRRAGATQPRLPRREAEQRHPCLDHRPEARLFRKGPGKEARLSFMGHLLMENRSGLVVGTV